MSTLNALDCLCGDPRCDASAAALDDGPAYIASAGTCPCGGRINVIGELNTLAERTEFLRCVVCRKRSERTMPVCS